MSMVYFCAKDISRARVPASYLERFRRTVVAPQNAVISPYEFAKNSDDVVFAVYLLRSVYSAKTAVLFDNFHGALIDLMLGRWKKYVGDKDKPFNAPEFVVTMLRLADRTDAMKAARVDLHKVVTEWLRPKLKPEHRDEFMPVVDACAAALKVADPDLVDYSRPSEATGSRYAWDEVVDNFILFSLRAGRPEDAYTVDILDALKIFNGTPAA